MVESVDTKDLKSFGQWWLCGFKSRSRYNRKRKCLTWKCWALLLSREWGEKFIGFAICVKTKSPAPNGAGDFYRLIVGLVRCTLGSSVADLQRICTTKLLLDLCNNTHLGLFVCLDRHSHQTLVRLFHRRTLVDDKVTNLLSVCESVIQLDTCLSTVLLAELSSRSTYIDLTNQWFFLQFSQLCCLWVLDGNLVCNLLHWGNRHKEEEQHENDIRQWTGVQSWHLSLVISTNFCHNYFPP